LDGNGSIENLETTGGRATVNGTPAYTADDVPAVFGRSMYFESASAVDSGDCVDGGAYLSAFLWVKLGSALVANDYVLAQWDEGAGKRAFAIGLGSSTNKMRVLLSSDGSATEKIYETTNAFFGSGWHHIGFVFDSGTLTVYGDGGALAVTKTSDSALASVNDAGDEVVIGGRYESDVVVGGINAYIADVKIWESALTTDQIAILAGGGHVSGAVLDTLYNGKPTDKSGHDNHGTITGATYSSDGPTELR